MYNDNTFDNLFTGRESGGVYYAPTASQNLAIVFSGFYLSAMDGDFTTDPVTITSETGESEDITIGNAPAKVLTATMLNPSNTMGSLVWGDGSVYIGCETATATADTYNSYPVHILAGSVHYGINSSGNARRNSTNYTLGGTPVAVISNATGNDVLFITDTKIGRYNGSFSTITTPTAEQAYLAAKMRAMPYSVGVLLDANGCPSVYNSVEKNTKQTFGYVPMGVFDFSNVDAYGITFGVEAYDKMTVFDGDCTSWWNAIDFDNGGSGRQLSWIAGELYTQFGFIGSPTIDASAVNDSLVWDTNPITSYAVTGRDILKWLAEAMGCNARMGRTGGLEFWTFATEPVTTVATIYPDIIISNTRVKGKATVPKMTETICYNVLGAGYQVGTSGSPYYVVANPFIDPSGDLTSLTNINGLVTGIPAYYPNTISVACGDPRWDAGDFVTVNTTDGTSPYAVPIMHQSLSWNGTCVTYLAATGKQVRDIPEGMNNTDLSSMVDSNPSAVVNKIQAVGIDADWITAGTISDRNGNNTWNLDTGDLSITTGKIETTYTHTYYYADYDASDITRITQIMSGQITPTDADYEKYDTDGNGYIRLLDRVRIQAMIDNQENLTKTITTTIDPSANNKAIAIRVQIPAIGPAAAVDRYATYAVSQVNVNTATFVDLFASNAHLDEVLIQDDISGDIELGSGSILFNDTNSITTVTMNGSSLDYDDGSNNHTVVTPMGITYRDGVASPTERILRRTRSSSGTSTVALEAGVYIAYVTHTNSSTATETGMYIIQAGSTSSIREVVAAGNQTLSVSGLTLTWTTSNSNRQLRLVYIS